MGYLEGILPIEYTLELIPPALHSDSEPDLQDQK